MVLAIEANSRQDLPGSQLAGVFGEGGVAAVVQAVFYAPVVCPVSSGTAGREVRLHDRAGSGWVGADVQAAFLESLQCLAVAEGRSTLGCAFLHVGLVQHGLDQLARRPGVMCRDSARGDASAVPPGRFGGDFGCGDCALIVADLGVPT